jgi:hypothetical protein
MQEYLPLIKCNFVVILFLRILSRGHRNVLILLYFPFVQFLYILPFLQF